MPRALSLLASVLGAAALAGCAGLTGEPNPSAPPGPARGQTTNPSPRAEGWKPLFDGKSLKGWKRTDFAGGGDIEVKDGQLFIRSGQMLCGVNWTNDIPKTNYEITLEAMKLEGGDFFCGLTLPFKDSHFTFILGGWGGGVVGISSIDGMDASENDTTKIMAFEKGRWYRIRVRVTPAKIQAWVDDENFVDQPIDDRRISMRPGEIELSEPLGLATYQTTSVARNIRIRNIEAR